jgi:uncharacterized protein (DUF1800 family)
MRQRTLQAGIQAAKGLVVSSLCALMIAGPGTPAWAASADDAMTPTGVRTTPLSEQEKTLHALNRLTFGPRPGDEAAMQKMGFEAWLERQLHPETIDDSAFEQRMNSFPAMKLSQEELSRRFPSPQMIRAISLRGASMPSDPELHAIYADAEAAYTENQKRVAAGVQPIGAPPVNDQDPAMQAQDPNASKMDAGTNDMAGQSMQAQTATPVRVTGKEGTKTKDKYSETPMPAAQVNAVLALPADARMQKLLALSPQQMLAFREGLTPQDRQRLMQGLSPEQMEIVVAMQGPARVVGGEALETRLLRDVYSERQLQAVMTDFWLNHFNVYVRKNQNEAYYLPDYERKVVLPHALGNFESLLIATAQSPAMLVYLDNWESVGPDSSYVQQIEARKKLQEQAQKLDLLRTRPNAAQALQRLPEGINENYARELMELHTLGVNGGYTQKDVQEVAKVFTGWTIDKPFQAGGGEPIFDPSRHEAGDKVVLGHTIKSGGQKEGLEVLHLLATSPATAKFISTKLAIRFVSDDPSPVLIDQMAATFLKTNGDIKSVLRTMFHSPEFWAPETYRAKVKTPLEFVASALRASNAEVRNPQALVQALDRLGMPIYGMQTPNGYSWKKDDWVSSNALIGRMNFALVLSGGRVPGTMTSWPPLLGVSGDTDVVSAPTPATEKQLESLILGEPAADRTRETVLQQFNNPTAQQTAEKSFNQRPASDPEMAEANSGTMGGASMNQAAAPGGAVLMRARAGRGQGPNLNQPETPLDTMAGLLMGSPDFQRK